MKQRLADYVADFLVARGVTDVFSVVGGGAMHLNDALGHNPRLHVTYNHHEQACAIAAEAYARLENKIAAVCVTTGPGGTNALTGVVGGWLDSIPMFIVSGQVRYDTTARYALQYTGTPLRAMVLSNFCRKMLSGIETIVTTPQMIARIFHGVMCLLLVFW